jgi:hypothetical protein
VPECQVISSRQNLIPSALRASHMAMVGWAVEYQLRASGRSIPAESARRVDRLQFAKIEIANRVRCRRGGAVSRVFRQRFQPGGVPGPQVRKRGNGAIPAAEPAPAKALTRLIHLSGQLFALPAIRQHDSARDGKERTATQIPVTCERQAPDKSSDR